MTRISKGDYIIYDAAEESAEGKAKATLVKVVACDDSDTFTAKLQKNVHIKSEVITINTSKILLNLGTTPYPGKYLGIDLADRYRGAIDTSIGTFHAFIKINKEEREILENAADNIKSKLEALGLDFILDADIVFELSTARSSKHYGMYYTPTKKAAYHRIQLYRAALNKKVTGLTPEYTIAHELGHLLDFGWVSKGEKPRAAWVAAYQTSTEATTIDKSRVRELYDKITYNEFGDNKNLRELAGNLDVEEVVELKAIIRWIKQARQVDAKDINALVASKDVSSFGDLWPRHAISVKSLKPILTEYATKNSRELFAECFAAYMTDMKLPSSLEGLLQKSIRFAKIHKA